MKEKSIYKAKAPRATAAARPASAAPEIFSAPAPFSSFRLATEVEAAADEDSVEEASEEVAVVEVSELVEVPVVMLEVPVIMVMPELVIIMLPEEVPEEGMLVVWDEDSSVVVAALVDSESLVAVVSSRLVAEPVGLAVERSGAAEVAPRLTSEVLLATVVSVSSTKYGV